MYISTLQRNKNNMRNPPISTLILLLIIFVLNAHFSCANIQHIYEKSISIPYLGQTIERQRTHNVNNRIGYPGLPYKHATSFQGAMKNKSNVHDKMEASRTDLVFGKHIWSLEHIARPETGQNFVSSVNFNKDETTQNKKQLPGRVKRSKRLQNGLVKHLARAFKVPDEIYQRTPDLIRRYGYPVEEHYVTTDDGYIIALHRIPGRRPPPEGAVNRNVVLLMSCGICSSADYVNDDPEHSLGFVLANAGLDVWLGNFRGNSYGRNHTSLDPDTDKRFWRFSFDEVAKYDLPAFVAFIRRHTGVDKLFFVGHSSSTLSFFMSAAGPNSFADKVRLMVAMAPIAYRGNSTGLTAISMQALALLRVPLETFGTGELYQRSQLLNTLLYVLCHDRSVIHDTCVSLFTSLTGGHNRGLINKSRLPNILSHMLSGASARMVAHLGQLITAPGIQMFDFGTRENLERYGRPTPPLYSVANITCPTQLYWSDNDKPNSPKDIARLAADLPHLVGSTRVNDSTIGHLDFIFAKNARSLVYDHMLTVMKAY